MDYKKIREDFPILSREVYGKPLVYLDNAATTQKPRCVVDAISDEYYNANANVHRGVHFLSQQATSMHEAARKTVCTFVGASNTNEIVFTRGTTESINLLASSLSKISNKNEVVVSVMEHHSNIVPWQLNGFKVKPFVDLNDFESLISDKTAIVSVAHVSNVLGIQNPIKDIIRIAHERGIPVMLDAAQSVPHMKVDVKELDCDFLAFSGHKVYGPTGIGVFYGKEALLDKLPPYQGGGEMIDHVSFSKTTFNALPYKFEAGTPDYIGSHALAVALDYISSLGMSSISDYESQLTQYAIQQLQSVEGLKTYGLGNNVENRCSVVSFNLFNEGTLIHHLDVGTLLDRLGIAVRTGHHCAEPLMHYLNIEGTVRASFSFYNTTDEVDMLVAGLQRIRKMF
ncbi:MAG: SufS family cysteine desulfurase [Prevotellaceae bacterium]|nr:SufS family cysteine desulfurase [Candidatus Colivivens equi]